MSFRFTAALIACFLVFTFSEAHAQVVTTDLTLNYNANVETDLTWESVPAAAGNEWVFTPGQVSLNSVSSATTIIEQAYNFNGTGGASNQGLNDLPGDPSDADATWEFWLRPAVGTDTDRIFETGGAGDGMSVVYNGNTNEVTFTFDDGSVQRSVTGGSTLIDTTDFHQIVGVYDKNSGGLDRLYLYVDGMLEDSDETTNSLNDWDGGDTSTLGVTGTGLAEGTPGNTNFEGDLAIFRFYEAPLSAADVQQNFDALQIVPEPASVAMWLLLGVIGAGVCWRMRRRDW